MDKALYAFATARVLPLRATSKDAWLKANTHLGILLPSFFGRIVLTYGEDVGKLDIVISIVGILGILQLILSIIAVVFTWEESKNYYIESSISNRNLFEASQDSYERRSTRKNKTNMGSRKFGWLFHMQQIKYIRQQCVYNCDWTFSIQL